MKKNELDWLEAARLEDFYSTEEERRSSEIGAEAVRYFVKEFGRIPPADRWQRLELAIRAYDETYAELADRKYIGNRFKQISALKKIYASCNLIGDSIVNLTIHIPLVYDYGKTNDEFRDIKMMSMVRNNVSDFTWDSDEYVTDLKEYMFMVVSDLKKRLLGRDKVTAFKISGFERYIELGIADTLQAIENLKNGR